MLGPLLLLLFTIVHVLKYFYRYYDLLLYLFAEVITFVYVDVV